MAHDNQRASRAAKAGINLLEGVAGRLALLLQQGCDKEFIEDHERVFRADYDLSEESWHAAVQIALDRHAGGMQA